MWQLITCGALALILGGCGDDRHVGLLDTADVGEPDDVPFDALADAPPECTNAPVVNPLDGSAIGGGALCGHLTVFAIDRNGAPVAGATVGVDAGASHLSATSDEGGRAVFEDPALVDSLTVSVSDETHGLVEVHGVRGAVASLRFGQRVRPVGGFTVRTSQLERLDDTTAAQYAMVWCIESNPWPTSWVSDPSNRLTNTWGAGEPSEGAFAIKVYLDTCAGLAVTGGTFEPGSSGTRWLGVYQEAMPAPGETKDVAVALTIPFSETRHVVIAGDDPSRIAQIYPYVQLAGGRVLWLGHGPLNGTTFTTPTLRELGSTGWGVEVLGSFGGVMLIAAPDDDTIVVPDLVPGATTTPALAEIQLPADGTLQIAAADDTDVVVFDARNGPEGALGDTIIWLAPERPAALDLATLPARGVGLRPHIESFALRRFDAAETTLEDLGRTSVHVTTLDP